MLRYALLLALALAAIPLLGAYTQKRERAKLLAGSAPRIEPVEQMEQVEQAPPEPPTVERMNEQAAVALHRWYTQEFIDQEGFGIARISTVEMLVRACTIGGERFKIQRTLIGDWREGGPRLYDGASVGPLMKKMLRRIKSLPLDQLDTVALNALRGGAELVIDSERTRMHGAIRAQRSCTKCHDVAIGTILGAMRYDLTRRREINLVPTSDQPSERR